MADIYTPPPDFAYLLSSPFSMPSDQGDRWAVSFTGNSATLVAAALSVVVTISFLYLWNLVSFAALWLDNGRNASRRRYAAMVTIWNSNDPFFAFKELLHYTVHGMQDGLTADFWYGAGFCLAALAVFGGSIAMGIVAPSLVQIGNVAPVRPSTVFYPDVPNGPAQMLQDFALRVPGVMRALGSVEAAEVTLRSRVMVHSDGTFAAAGGDGGNVHLDYSYSLSGVDFGLQGGTDLNLAVEGACVTEYGWIVDNPLFPDEDEYHLWGEQSMWAVVNVDAVSTQRPPFAGFYLHLDAPQQLIRDSNVSYAVVAHSAQRPSIREGGDPWYATELRLPEDMEEDGDGLLSAPYRVKRRRPVLSCWEKDAWSYRGEAVASIFDLKAIPDITIPRVLLQVLEATLGGGPMLARLGNAAGASALRSSTTSISQRIDAQASSIERDMTRLILASFAATRAIFTDATMFARPENYPNTITGDDGQPQEGAGNFVVSSPNIQTFSLTGIVILAVILLLLLVVNLSAWALVRHHLDKMSGQEQRVSRWMRFRVLAALQLFRSLYGNEERVSAELEWACDSPIPKHNEPLSPLVMSRCKDQNKKCLGHIALLERSDDSQPTPANRDEKNKRTTETEPVAG